MLSVFPVNSLSYKSYLNDRFFLFLHDFSPLHWFLIGFCPCPVRLSTDVICLPIHPGFSLNVFPAAFKNWPWQTMDFSSQCLFLSVEVTVLCKTPFAGMQQQCCALLSALLTPTPQAASGFVWGLVHPYSTPCTLYIMCSRTSLPGTAAVLSWRSCQGSSLLLSAWKVLHHSLLTIFRIFYIQNRLIWWVLLFFCLVLIIFPISANKKKILLLGLIFL